MMHSTRALRPDLPLPPTEAPTTSREPAPR